MSLFQIAQGCWLLCQLDLPGVKESWGYISICQTPSSIMFFHIPRSGTFPAAFCVKNHIIHGKRYVVRSPFKDHIFSLFLLIFSFLLRLNKNQQTLRIPTFLRAKVALAKRALGGKSHGEPRHPPRHRRHDFRTVWESQPNQGRQPCKQHSIPWSQVMVVWAGGSGFESGCP